MTIQQVTASWKDGRIVVAGNAPFLTRQGIWHVQEQRININNREMTPVCLQIHDLAGRQKPGHRKKKKKNDGPHETKKETCIFWMNSESLNNGSPANAALSIFNLSRSCTTLIPPVWSILIMARSIWISNPILVKK